MTSRERVVTAVRHHQPDRVPVDLGAMDSTGITAIAYNRLKRHLGISGGATRIYDPYQQVAEVELTVLEAIGGDVLPVIHAPRRYKPEHLPDGSACEIPELWNPRTLDDGSEEVRDAEGHVIAQRPAGGFYFEPTHAPLAEASTVHDIESKAEVIQSFDWPSYCDEDFDDLAAKAQRLAEDTDYALMGNFAIHIFAAGQLLRGHEQFMVDLVWNRPLVCAMFDILVDAYSERLRQYAAAVGPYVQIINVNDDLGTQTGCQVSPALYREVVKPYQSRIYHEIKQATGAFLFLHSDGAISDVIPDLIEIGVDILNPIQYTACRMESERLKREFGRDLAFWGGGCDTQNVLPRGTPEEVRREVLKQLRILAPGGGYVFNQVHNIQPDVPAGNILAMYDAVREFNGGAG